MERILIDWLIRENDSIWITEYIKSISEKGIHITIKSLRKYCSDNEKDNNDDNSRLLNEMKELFNKYKDSKTKHHKFEYCYTWLFTPDIKKLNLSLICFEIFLNNKKLLIKKQHEEPIENTTTMDNGESGNKFLNKIWRNKTILKEILLHLELFNKNQFKIQFKSVYEFHNYKFKDYLNNIAFYVKDSKNKQFIEDGALYYLTNHLPPNIKTIDFGFNTFNEYIKPFSFPSTVKSLIFDNFDHKEKTSGNIMYQMQLFHRMDNNYTYEIYPRLSNSISELIIFQETVDFKYQIIFTGNAHCKHLKTCCHTLKHDEDNSLVLDKAMFPKSLKSISITRDVNINLEKDLLDRVKLESLPDTIEKLSYTIPYRGLQIKQDIWPPSLTDLKLSNLNFIFDKESIKKNVLPPLLQALTLGSYYNSFDLDVLPKSLLKLTLSSKYNKTIHKCCLPESLEYLSFRIKHDSPSNRPNVESSKFGFGRKKYQYPVLTVGSLPLGIKVLKLSEYQSFLDILVKGTLTDGHKSLTYLSIQDDRYYDFKTQNINTLQIDQIQAKINNQWSIDKFIPPSLTKISLNTQTAPNQILVCLPFTHIKTKTTNPNYVHFPISMQSLKFKSTISISPNISNYPQNLKSLSFNFLRCPLTCLDTPPSLTVLDLSNDLLHYSNHSIYNHSFQQDSIPKTLKTLILGDVFSKELNIERDFPNLENLIVCNSKPIIINFDPYNGNSKLNQIIVFNTNLEFINNNLSIYSFIKICSSFIQKKKFKKLYKL